MSGRPADWTAWRAQWEAGHALRFALHLAAFVLVAASLTRASGAVATVHALRGGTSDHSLPKPTTAARS